MLCVGTIPEHLLFWPLTWSSYTNAGWHREVSFKLLVTTYHEITLVAVSGSYVLRLHSDNKIGVV